MSYYENIAGKLDLQTNITWDVEQPSVALALTFEKFKQHPHLINKLGHGKHCNG